MTKRQKMIDIIRDLNSDSPEMLGKSDDPWRNEYLRGQVELATFLLLKDNLNVDPSVFKEDLMNDVLADDSRTADTLRDAAKAAAQSVIDANNLKQEDGETPLAALGWAMGEQIEYEDALIQFAAAVIRADRDE